MNLTVFIGKRKHHRAMRADIERTNHKFSICTQFASVARCPCTIHTHAYAYNVLLLPFPIYQFKWEARHRLFALPEIVADRRIGRRHATRVRYATESTIRINSNYGCRLFTNQNLQMRMNYIQCRLLGRLSSSQQLCSGSRLLRNVSTRGNGMNSKIDWMRLIIHYYNIMIRRGESGMNFNKTREWEGRRRKKHARTVTAEVNEQINRKKLI